VAVQAIFLYPLCNKVLNIEIRRSNMRIVLYERYSSENRTENSIEG